MKFLLVTVIFVLLATTLGTFAGTEIANESTGVLDLPRVEMAVESAYLLGVFGNPNSYEIGAEFLTARVRWGTINTDSWFRGYNQFYVSAMAEPIFRGVENHYFGLNFGSRYNFVRPGTRFVPYISAGLGLGWISYKMNDHWKLNAGILYQHLSNGGQTDPNPSLNLLGPQVGLDYSF